MGDDIWKEISSFRLSGNPMKIFLKEGGSYIADPKKTDVMADPIIIKDGETVHEIKRGEIMVVAKP